MGGNQSQQQQSLNPYQGNLGPPQDYEYTPSQAAQFATGPSGIPLNPSQSRDAGPNYFDVLMDDLYQRMKARAATDTAGYDDYASQSEEGFSF